MVTVQYPDPHSQRERCIVQESFVRDLKKVLKSGGKTVVFFKSLGI